MRGLSWVEWPPRAGYPRDDTSCATAAKLQRLNLLLVEPGDPPDDTSCATVAKQQRLNLESPSCSGLTYSS